LIRRSSGGGNLGFQSMVPPFFWVAIGFLMALIVMVTPRRALGALSCFGGVFLGVSAGVLLSQPASTWAVAWVPALGVELSLAVEGLRQVFASLILGIGGLIVVFATGYLGADVRCRKLIALLLAFMASMVGLVLSTDPLGLFLFWELTSFFSYLLIGFEDEDPVARRAARQAFVITGAGGLVLLVGLLMGGASASPAAAICVLIGAMTKSALWPFHFWLPGAMAAPTPISAYLHSATMVKGGVFLLFVQDFSKIEFLHPYLIASAAVTGLIALRMSLFECDLKKLLAASTLGALAMLALLATIPGAGPLAFAAVLVAHALYKGALFMIAGGIDHATGTRNVRELSGLRKAMPMTATAAALAGVAMMGLPPTLAFWAKETALGLARPAIFAVLELIAVGAVVVAVRVAFFPFWGRDCVREAHENPPTLWLGPAVLAGLGLLGPLLLMGPPLRPFLSSLATQSSQIAYWHGFNALFFVSLGTIAVGIGLAFWAQKRPEARAPAFSAADWTESLLTRIPSWGSQLSKLVSGGKLRNELGLFFAVAAGLMLFGLISGGGFLLGFRTLPPTFEEIVIVALAALAAGVALVQGSRIAVIALLGISGSAIALIYLAYGAPDLAITQFLIEMLTVILFVLGFARLPRFRSLSGGSTRVRDALIALAFGGMMSLLLLGVLSSETSGTLSDYFLQNAVPEAYGRNVVNTIIVDFRALDTLGEIVVIAMAALGVSALLLRRKSRSTP